MNIWQASAGLIKDRPKLYILNALAWTAINAAPLLPGSIRSSFSQQRGNAAVVASRRIRSAWQRSKIS